MAISKKRGIKSSAQDNFLEPNAVTNLTATDVGTSRPYLATANTTSAASAAGTGAAASLSWSLPAASPPATSYTITTTPATYTVITGNTNTSYTFQGLASNGSYTFTVVATNNAGSSQPTTSSSTQVTTVPQAPTASVSSGGAVPSGYDRITYSANATGGKSITTFRIVGSVSGTVSSNLTAGQSPYDFLDPTASETSSDTAESYTVYVSNNNGESVGTSTASIQTFSPPHFPP
ncbi:MAG: hypothetical protein EBX97_07315, partial [Actinobacteria bacterium]|nr:hypothetical protein [Actinomycetota bacterium]